MLGCIQQLPLCCISVHRHDIATSHTDASVKAIMEACVSENDADKHVTNIKVAIGQITLLNIFLHNVSSHPPPFKMMQHLNFSH